MRCSRASPSGFRSHRVRGGAYEDLVERDALRPADREGAMTSAMSCAEIPISAVAVLFACLLAGSVM